MSKRSKSKEIKNIDHAIYPPPSVIHTDVLHPASRDVMDRMLVTYEKSSAIN